jgi:hypothetical protein
LEASTTWPDVVTTSASPRSSKPTTGSRTSQSWVVGQFVVALTAAMLECFLMGVDLSSARAKLGQAEKHLGSLAAEVARYQQRDPYMPFIQPRFGPDIPTEVETQNAVLVIALYVKPVPEVIYLIAGDAIHNLRSALDYLAWQLVLISGGNPERSKPQFPVQWDTPNCYDTNGIPILMSNQKLRPDIRRLLDSKWLQPYHAADPDGHPLYFIHNLDIIDKHRHLNVISTSIGGGLVVLGLPCGRTLTMEHKGLARADGGQWRQMPLENGTPLAVFTYSDVGDVPYTEMDVDSQVAIEITIGEIGSIDNPALPITDQIGGLIAFVRDRVIPEFAALS